MAYFWGIHFSPPLPPREKINLKGDGNDQGAHLIHLWSYLTFLAWPCWPHQGGSSNPPSPPWSADPRWRRRLSSSLPAWGSRRRSWARGWGGPSPHAAGILPLRLSACQLQPVIRYQMYKKVEGKEQRSNIKEQMSKVKGQRTEVKGQRSKVRNQRSKVRNKS